MQVEQDLKKVLNLIQIINDYDVSSQVNYEKYSICSQIVLIVNSCACGIRFEKNFKYYSKN